MIKKCPKCGKTRDIDSYDKICWECREEEAREKLASDLKNGVEDETFCEDEIFCPWCGVHYDPELADGLPEGDFICEECGKSYRVTCEVTVQYSTVRLEGEKND